MTGSTGRMPKVLIVAPNASSRFGGESFLPLQYFRILHRHGHPVRLVTHERNRGDLAEAHPELLPLVSFVPDDAAQKTVWRLGRHLPGVVREWVVSMLLLALERRATGRLVREVLRTEGADVIHQPTPVSPLTPSSLHRFGRPLIIGPMNGGMNYPSGYENLESRGARAFVAGARAVARVLNRLVPGKRRAAVLLVANDRTRAALPFPDHPDVREIVENAVDRRTWLPGETRGRDAVAGSLRLVFMGRLVRLKLMDVTLRAVALARARGADVTLEVLGDGDERGALEALARDLGLEGAVRFHGFLPQAECAQRLGQADALILNSVRECGGAVVLEAMALARPVIASDWGGPADYLDPSCGILVPPSPAATFAERTAEAILRLASDPALRAKLGEAGARKVADQFDWDQKVDEVAAIYAEVAARPTQGRPGFEQRESSRESITVS